MDRFGLLSTQLDGNTKLSDFAIALGVMYIVTTLFESIGVVGSILVCFISSS